jgi:hypothetical protein
VRRVANSGRRGESDEADRVSYISQTPLTLLSIDQPGHPGFRQGIKHMYGNAGALTKFDIKAAISPGSNAGKKSASETNCEFCAAAGAVNLTPGAPRQTSRQAAEYAGLKDLRPPAAGGIAAQAKRIVKFVVAKTGRRWGSSGGAGFAEKPYAEVEKFMAQMRNGTVFVIYISAPTAMDVKTKLKPGQRSHWLNAKKMGNNIHYFDFQTNRNYSDGAFYGMSEEDLKPVGGQNPSSSMMPFVGVEIQTLGKRSADDKSELNQALHSSDYRLQRGIFDTSHADTKMLALAFFPAKVATT